MHDNIRIHMTSCTLSKISHHAVTFTHTVLMSSHQHTFHRIHCGWAITYSVLIIAHLQHVWYETHYMYDIIWILCDITTNLYDIARLYSWYQFHTIHDITPTVYDMIYTTCDITASLTMTRHLLYFWHYTQGIWHLTCWMNDNTTTVSDMILNVSL